MHDEIVSNARKAQQKLSKAAADIGARTQSSLCSNSFRYRRISCISAEKMIEKEIDANVHNELFDQFIAKVGGSHE